MGLMEAEPIKRGEGVTNVQRYPVVQQIIHSTKRVLGSGYPLIRRHATISVCLDI